MKTKTDERGKEYHIVEELSYKHDDGTTGVIVRIVPGPHPDDKKDKKM